ncbi:SDR family NAD(P)-dependent oxidoreductase, partial [Sphingobium sp. Z007]|uniref:SDR family NAD(P)-dependent oxidoreductase n=1 Tax=Sphingobium sp. Z007 TaxID=627495 RepID=UPI000B49F319
MSAIYPSLRGKRVFISGGGSGEGLVEAFVGQGAHVAFCDIAVAESEALVARLQDADVAPIFHAIDLRDIDAVQAMIATVETQLGGIDILINNAANDDRHTIEEVTPAYWDERMAVNLRHLFFAAQAAAPAMKRAGGGVILNFGSISWHLALPELTLYQTAKAAIEGLTRSLARDLGRDNIRVNTIIPGNVKTPRQEKWYTPEGEAEIVAAQCLDG